MKKILILLSALCIAFMLSACTEAEKSGIQKASELYSGISESSRIEQALEISIKNLVVFYRTCSLDKSGDAFDAVIDEKRLNEIGASNAYTVNTKTMSVSKSEVAKLNFDEKYFSEKYEFDSSGLKAVVKKENLAEFVGAADITLPTSDLDFEMSVQDGKVTQLKMNYLAGEFSVSIVTSYTY